MNLSNALFRQFSTPRPRCPSNLTFLRTSRLSGNINSNINNTTKYKVTKKIGVWLQEQSIEVARACTRQVEFIAAQRIRRGLQLFQLYTKIWDELALKEFLRAWRRRVRRSGKDFLLASVGVTAFNWEKDRIDENELYSYAEEIDVINKLKDETVVCSKCHLRLIIDKAQSDVKYCLCHGKHGFVAVKDDAEWQPFIERKDMLIWRREEPDSGGLYAYKVFGNFSDVSAREFLRVQVDVEYRKEWDPTAKRLEIIDSDPEFHCTDNSRTDVVYWEMIWPRLFSNRDYVYQRRWVLDEEKGIVLIVSRITDHPNAPQNPDTYRVTSYWSYMVIKPSSGFDQPGIEFSLTYFEDPGVNIPTAVSSWVAMSGLPDFLNKMRQAAKDYKDYKAKKHHKEELTVIEQKNDGFIGEIQLNLQENEKLAPESSEIRLNTIEDEKNELNSKNKVINDDSLSEIEVNSHESSDGDELTEQNHEKQNSYLRYFFLTKLFA